MKIVKRMFDYAVLLFLSFCCVALSKALADAQDWQAKLACNSKHKMAHTFWHEDADHVYQCLDGRAFPIECKRGEWRTFTEDSKIDKYVCNPHTHLWLKEPKGAECVPGDTKDSLDSGVVLSSTCLKTGKWNLNECDPNDKSAHISSWSESIGFSGSRSVNYYRCSEDGLQKTTIPKEGEIVTLLAELEKSEKLARDKAQKEAKHKKELSFALRSRLLTDAEMEEVIKYDYYLMENRDSVCWGNCPDISLDLKAEFMLALLQQFKLKVAAEHIQKCPCSAPCAPADASMPPEAKK